MAIPRSRRTSNCFSVLVRISIPGEDEHGGPNPHPNYGDQIQNQGLMGQDRDATYLGDRVRPEANVYLDWQEAPVTFADGERVMLRKPRLRVEKLNFGPLGPEVMYSLRIALPTFGLGLLEAVSEADILAIAERQKTQGVERPSELCLGRDRQTDCARPVRLEIESAVDQAADRCGGSWRSGRDVTDFRQGELPAGAGGLRVSAAGQPAGAR